MRQAQEVRELQLRTGDQVITLPVLEVSLWEDTDEEGYVGEFGYTYYTHYGKVITRITATKEFTDSLIEEFGEPEEVKAKVWEVENGRLIAVGDEVFYVPDVWEAEDENL